MQLEKIAFENRVMHDRHLRVLKALQEEAAKQKPTSAAGIEIQLIQTSIEVMKPLSYVAPDARRTRSEQPTSENPGWYLDPGMGRPRSLSVGSSTVFENNVESVSDISQSPGMDLCFEPTPKSTLEASETVDWPQTTQILLHQEPPMSVQVSHRPKSKCRHPCSCQCHQSSKLKTLDFLRQVTGQLLIGYAGIPSTTPVCNEHACAKRQKAAVRISILLSSLVACPTYAYRGIIVRWCIWPRKDPAYVTHSTRPCRSLYFRPKVVLYAAYSNYLCKEMRHLLMPMTRAGLRFIMRLLLGSSLRLDFSSMPVQTYTQNQHVVTRQLRLLGIVSSLAASMENPKTSCEKSSRTTATLMSDSLRRCIKLYWG